MHRFIWKKNVFLTIFFSFFFLNNFLKKFAEFSDKEPKIKEREMTVTNNLFMKDDDLLSFLSSYSCHRYVLLLVFYLKFRLLSSLIYWTNEFHAKYQHINSMLLSSKNAVRTQKAICRTENLAFDEIPHEKKMIIPFHRIFFYFSTFSLKFHCE